MYGSNSEEEELLTSEGVVHSRTLTCPQNRENCHPLTVVNNPTISYTQYRIVLKIIRENPENEFLFKDELIVGVS
jgi:hypothetical protein